MCVCLILVWLHQGFESVACVCASYLFGYTKALSVMRQGTNMDVIRAHEQIHLVIDELQVVRENVDEEFDHLFYDMEKMAKEADIELRLPRNCQRQTLRNNVPTDGSVKAYWKRAVFIPYLDALITDLSARFTSLSREAVRGLCLLPANLAQCTDERVDDTIRYYGPDMPSPASAKQEIRILKRYWAGHGDSDMPATLHSTVEAMNSRQFPCISAVLNVLQLFPVTSAEVERAHSAFKLIKTRMRSTTGEDRLNAFVLLYYHTDIPLADEAIVDIYA